MINCTEAVKQLWDYVENDVADDAREQIDEHLAVCRRCCGEVEFAEELQVLMRHAAKPHIPEEVSRRLADYLNALEGSA